MGHEFNLNFLTNTQVKEINLNKIKNNLVTSKVLDALVEGNYFLSHISVGISVRPWM